MNLFELFGKIVVNNTDANKKITDTKGKAEGLYSVFTNVGNMTVKFGDAMTKSVGLIGGAWAATVEGSREYRTEMGKLNAAFTTSGHTTETAAAAYRTLYGVIGETDQAVEAAQQIALLAESEKEVVEWSGLAAGVVGRFGDALQPETFFESANETLKLCEATGAYVQMLEGVGMNVDDFNAGLAQCGTEAERQAYMLDVTKKALGEASDAYNENNKDIIDANAAQADLTDSMAKIGEMTEPAMTKLKESVADLVETALPSLQSFMTWMQENGEATALAIGAIATSMAVAAVAAHPYAAAVTAVVAALAYLNSESGQRRATFDHMFDGFTEENINTLNRYVEAENALRAAQDVSRDDYNFERQLQAEAAADAALAEVTAVEGLLQAYNTWHQAQEGYEGANGMALKVPIEVSEDSEENVQGAVDSMNIEGIVTMIADTSGLQAAINATGLSASVPVYSGLGSIPQSRAVGLDNVPYDGYYAHLHKGEAILNRVQADAWRGGNTGKIEALLAQLVANTQGGQQVVLDSGAVVGQLAPAMDARLGTILNRKRRGN